MGSEDLSRRLAAISGMDAEGCSLTRQDAGKQADGKPEATAGMAKKAYLVAASALFAGGVIYVLWRQDSILLFRWLDALGIMDSIALLRGVFRPLSSHLPGWIVFSLPDGLWAFSYALIMTHLWRGENSRMRCFWLASIPVVGMGYELLQGVGWIHGVFCPTDFLFCLVGMTAGGLIGIALGRKGGNR